MPLKKIISFVFDLFFLIRPTLLVPVWTVLFLGWVTARDRNFFDLSLDFSSPFSKMFLAFTAVVGYIYIVNQIVDRESDRINNKLFILPNNHVSVHFAGFFAGALLVFSLLLSWFYLDLLCFLIILLAAILGFFYNCRPFKLKDRPWGGFIANSFGHGVLTYYAGWYVAHLSFTYGADLSQPFGIPAIGFVYALSAGFANGAVYLSSTISDLEGDKKVNKRTFTVVYGIKNTSLLATICVCFSFLTAFLIPYSSWTMIIPSAICVPLFFSLYKTQKIENAFKTFRYPVVILSIMTSVFVPAYAVLVIATVIISRIYYKKRFNYEYPSFSKER
jgi:4-hydroxybenzoate polyprenyltransferase